MRSVTQDHDGSPSCRQPSRLHGLGRRGDSAAAIRPKDVSSDESGDYAISFANASLTSFDKIVSRASCSASLTIIGPAESQLAEGTPIEFTVAPAAKDPSSFIVAGSLATFTQRMAAAIAGASIAREEWKNQQQAQQTLAALVKPGWLIGRRVKADQGSRFCAEGLFDQYLRGGRYVSGDTQGSWKLNEQELTIIGSAATVVLPITDATMEGFTVETPTSDPQSFRRCSADELQASSEMPSDPPEDSGPPVEPDEEPTPQQ